LCKLPTLRDRQWKRTAPEKMGQYETIYDYRNLLDAAHQCGNGVRWKCSVQTFEINRLRWCSNLQKALKDGSYKSKGFNEFYINERGKMRRIQSVHISERTVQKSLCNNVMKPKIVPKLIYDNSASLKGKGTDFALNRLKCHLERHYRKHGRKGGVLTIDFKNYFASIDHEKLLALLQKEFPDEGVYNFLSQFVTAFDEGLGLGSEISQISAIYLPNEVDHYIKERLHIKGYGRYMDDSYLIHEDIEYLKYCLTQIEKILDRLGITLNRNRTRITPLTQSFIFLKKRVHLEANGSVTFRLTRKNITARRRKMKKLKHKLDEGKISMDAIRQSYQSWRGYAEKYNTHNTLRNMDKLYFELYGEWPERTHNGRRSFESSKSNAGANE
jgi:RNA-directed DNA polymerase